MGKFGNLKLAEIEIFNYCNRTCEFCPNETIDRKSKVIELPEACFLNTLQELKKDNFSGYVTFSRYNEPLSQDKLLKKRAKQVREYLPNVTLIFNTNGDFLSKRRLDGLDVDEISVMDYDNKGVNKCRKNLERVDVKIDEIDYYDLYSCFPSMVELGREALDIPETTSKPLTVTGGLPFFGGAGNNYVSHSIATMMERLRENNNSKGLCTSNGWYATKHGIGLYSNIPYEGNWKREEPKNYQKTIDDLNRPDVDENPNGNAKIETYTVANGRDGPQMGIVIGRLDTNNNRFIAISNDEKTLEIMMTEECLNRDCVVSRNSEGFNIFSI